MNTEWEETEVRVIGHALVDPSDPLRIHASRTVFTCDNQFVAERLVEKGFVELVVDSDESEEPWKFQRSRKKKGKNEK
jgi:hypothetical protein